MALTSAARRSSGADPAPAPAPDDTDRVLLDLLLHDGRATLQELAAATGLSTSATSVRVRRLVERGVIAGFHARVDRAVLGRPVEVLVQVRVRADADLAAFEEALAGSAAVVSAWQVTGESDYAVHLACRSLPDVEEELRGLRAQPGVRHTSAQLLLHRVPSWSGAA
ncbi:Lrp/AsnC family transcriptional regulator [Promicromonospora sp. NPDC057488]|uniref:Lrp/AsnC family transcriptional regulator n=1 Tax=Promicromonospora sp. NPDC057488 TaxID=3346147 RepID=UPI003672C548